MIRVAVSEVSEVSEVRSSRPPVDLSQAGLEPGPEATRQLIKGATERVIEYLSTLSTRRASDMECGAEVARLVIESLPERGQNYDELLDLLFDRIIPKGYNTNSPGEFSHVNCGSMVHSAVADLITAVTNPFVGYSGPAPGLAQIEKTVIRWFADLLGLPDTAGGVLLSGGSMANLTALVTARRTMLGDDFGRGTIYASDQAHFSLRKAAIVAGFPPDAVRSVASDASSRMRFDALAECVRADRQAGRIPFCVVATAGTTGTGAIDDLPRIAEFARQEGLWFHVDAAYAGCFALTQRGKALLRGIEQADTVVLDPHKSLFTPYGTGCVLARDVDDLRRAHQLHSDYIEAAVEQGGVGATNFADLSLELSRGMRGLRIWLPIKLLGAEVFRRALDEKLDLARLAADRIRNLPGFELIAPPELSILGFRAHEPGASAAELDELNLAVLGRVNRRGRSHLSWTRLNGRVTLRLCVLSLRTHEPALAACLEDLRDCRQG